MRNSSLPSCFTIYPFFFSEGHYGLIVGDFFAIMTATSEKTSFKYKVSSLRSYFEIIPTAAPYTI